MLRVLLLLQYAAISIVAAQLDVPLADHRGAPLLRAVSISALALLGPPDKSGMSVLVGYHSKAGDGGGGQFVWDADSNDPDNSGTVIAPRHTKPICKGRWIRLAAQAQPRLMRPEWFGARANEPTFDSLPAFQAAHDALPELRLTDERTPSGRFMRLGVVSFGPASYYLGGTLYISARSILTGVGTQTSRLIALDGSFPAPHFPDDRDEKFLVEFEKPAGVTENNCFGTRLESLTLQGNARLHPENNVGVSGVRIFGAQGSRMKDVDIRSMGYRGADCRVPILGACWWADAIRGPMLDWSGGPGLKIEYLSLEHVNTSGEYIDAETGKPISAGRFHRVQKAKIGLLQFEGSPVELALVHSNSVDVDQLLINPIRESPSYSVLLYGDTRGFRLLSPIWYLGETRNTFQVFDDTLTARASGQIGEKYDRIQKQFQQALDSRTK